MGSKLIEDWRCPNSDDSSLYDVGGESGYIGRRPSASSKSSVGVRSSSPRRRTGSTVNDDEDDDDDDGTLLSLSTPVALIIIVAVCLAALLVAVGLVSYYVAVKV